MPCLASKDEDDLLTVHGSLVQRSISATDASAASEGFLPLPEPPDDQRRPPPAKRPRPSIRLSNRLSTGGIAPPSPAPSTFPIRLQTDEGGVLHQPGVLLRAQGRNARSSSSEASAAAVDGVTPALAVARFGPAASDATGGEQQLGRVWVWAWHPTWVHGLMACLTLFSNPKSDYTATLLNLSPTTQEDNGMEVLHVRLISLLMGPTDQLDLDPRPDRGRSP